MQEAVLASLTGPFKSVVMKRWRTGYLLNARDADSLPLAYLVGRMASLRLTERRIKGGNYAMSSTAVKLIGVYHRA